MNPNPHPTKAERAEELDVAAKIAYDKGDQAFALDLAQHAHLLRMQYQKEAQSIELRKAIIEKSLAGLVWMCILGIGAVFLSWATAHGFKP